MIAVQTLCDDGSVRINYDLHQGKRVIHVEHKEKFSIAAGIRFKRAVAKCHEALGEPVFAVYYTDDQNPQSGPWFDRWLRWNGFTPYEPGTYHGNPCVYYIKVS